MTQIMRQVQTSVQRPRGLTGAEASARLRLYGRTSFPPNAGDQYGGSVRHRWCISSPSCYGSQAGWPSWRECPS